MTDKKLMGRPTIEPHLKKNPISPRLPQWLIDWMDDQDEPRSILIERAMCQYYDICAPVHSNELSLTDDLTQLGTIIGNNLLNKGITKFNEWATALINELESKGISLEQIKPYVKKWYLQAQDDLTDEQLDLVDDVKTVRSTDIDNLVDETFDQPISLKVKAILQESLMSLPKYQQMNKVKQKDELIALVKLVAREEKALNQVGVPLVEAQSQAIRTILTSSLI